MTQFLSVAEAARQLDLKIEVAYHLVKVGLIAAETYVHRDGRRVVGIPQLAIDAFRRTYVHAGALAAPSGLNARVVGKCLIKKGIAAVSGPGVDDGRQWIFKRTPSLEQAVCEVGQEGKTSKGTAPAIPGTLVLRPAPKAGESLPGYLLRLASENRLKGLPGFVKSTGIGYSEALNLGLQGVWHRCQMTSPTASIPNCNVRSQIWSRSRVCPDCLRTEGYCHSDWDLPLRFSCSKHKRMLVAVCDCGLGVTYYRRSLYHCSCGRDLRRVTMEPVASWVVTLNEAVGLVHTEASAENGGFGVAARHIATLFALRALTDLVRAAPGKHVAPGAQSTPWLAAAETGLVRKLLESWPSGFLAAVGPRWIALSINVRSALRRKLQSLESTALMSELDRWTEEVTQVSADRQSRAPLCPPADGLVSLHRAALAYGVSPAYAKKLFSEGGMSAATMSISYAKTGAGMWVSADELTLAFVIRRESLDFEEAARFLGCDATIIDALVRGRFLAAAQLPRRLPRARVWVRDVVALVQSLKSRASVIDFTDAGLIKFSDFLPSRYGCISKGWVRLMDGIRTRKLCLFALKREPIGLGDFAFKATDVARFVPTSVKLSKAGEILLRDSYRKQ